MRTIIIASMDRNGVIGRTSKPCEGQQLLEGITDRHECHGGKVHRIGPPGTYGLAIDDCLVCNGTGRIPANDVPWSYPEIDRHFRRLMLGFIRIDSLESFAERDRFATERDSVFVHDPRGGAKLYAAALPLADELDLALIDATHDGDVKFPWSADSRRAASDLNPWAAYEFIETHGVRFDLVEQRQGSTPELTFTRWVRR